MPSHTFRTIAKHWPSGSELDLGVDTNTWTGESDISFNRTANQFETTDGETQLRFLFWHTGRRLTSKRSVRWNFSVLDWTLWTATKWYGTPGPGGPVALRVRTDGFSLNDNNPFPDSPINVGASTFTPPSAHPFGGDDHSIGTAGGPVTVVPIDPFHTLDFKGWLRIIWGGDPVGEFIETDEGPTPGSSGVGIFTPISGTNFDAAQNSAHDVIASYGHDASPPDSRLPWWFKEVFTERPSFRLPDRGDPAPDDWIRFKILEELIRQTKPGGEPPQTGGMDFRRVIEGVSRMSKEELKRSLQEIQTTMDLGKTAISAIEAQLKK